LHETVRTAKVLLFVPTADPALMQQALHPISAVQFAPQEALVMTRPSVKQRGTNFGFSRANIRHTG
jgi:hypothetical protein